MKETLSTRILKFSLYIIFVVGIFGTATLPFMLDSYFRLFNVVSYTGEWERTFITAFLISVAIPGLWILFEMILMMCSIPRGPFIMRNVYALRRCGVILLVITAMFLVKCFIDYTFLTMACVFLFLICGFFAFTLSNLFRQAVIFKEENELTI